MVRAIVKGYEDRLTDMQSLAVLSGYYSGYYMGGSKHPRSPDKVIREMVNAREKANTPKHYDDQATMDAKVAQFQEREERLRRYLNAGTEY